ncbi:nitroreductase family protein [Rhodococcus sp. IEGM 1408]|uniref:nitroreductase family protein n=1 Tax=Rhodococcus sp. IEGM 1408 TaxID=3082220 RepID=UPI0029556131|nr:nitroreductase family protein [Rhodococcus sp. IEGM 1408]MDV8002648.1 nitroreductase family protein [Rhodococcus sp. IEGM 1408]
MSDNPTQLGHPDPTVLGHVGAHELLTSTRAVRKRLDLGRPVHPALIEACVADALQAPQGSNLMRTEFVVVRDPDRIERLGRIYREEFDGFYRESELGLFNRVDSDPRHAAQSRRTRDSAEHLAEVMSRVPVIVIPCLTPRLAEGDVLTAKHRLATVYPTVWNFMLAARLRGLGTCWTGMTLGREDEVAEIVGIDPTEVEQVCMIPVAHHTGTSFRPAWRPPAEEFIHWDTW